MTAYLLAALALLAIEAAATAAYITVADYLDSRRAR